MSFSLKNNEFVRVKNRTTSLPGDNSQWEPPESISNSEVKTLRADDSVRSPHVKVGHRQAFKLKKRNPDR